MGGVWGGGGGGGGAPRSGDISRHTTGGVSTDHLWGVFFFNFYV